MTVDIHVGATCANQDLCDSELAAYLRARGFRVERDQNSEQEVASPRTETEQPPEWLDLKSTRFSDPRARRLLDWYEALSRDTTVRYEDFVIAAGGDRQALGAVIANIEATARKLGLGPMWARNMRRRGSEKERSYRKLLNVGSTAAG